MLFSKEQVPYQHALTHLPWTKKEYTIFSKWKVYRP